MCVDYVCVLCVYVYLFTITATENVTNALVGVDNWITKVCFVYCVCIMCVVCLLCVCYMCVLCVCYECIVCVVCVLYVICVV